MGRQGTADRRGPAGACRRRGIAGTARGDRVDHADRAHRRERAVRPGALPPRRVHHAAAGAPAPGRSRHCRLRGERAVARALPQPDGRGPGRAADRPVPARPDRRATAGDGPCRALPGPRPRGSEAGVLTLLLASLAPATAWAGIARRARSEALAQSAARQDIAGTLLEHTARGERARIVRELHDVVAHHLSMVAVQAETARLAT